MKFYGDEFAKHPRGALAMYMANNGLEHQIAYDSMGLDDEDFRAVFRVVYHCAKDGGETARIAMNKSIGDLLDAHGARWEPGHGYIN